MKAERMFAARVGDGNLRQWQHPPKGQAENREKVWHISR